MENASSDASPNNKNTNGFVDYDPDDKEYFGAATVVVDERRHILKRRQLNNASVKEQEKYLNENLTGLALSGGGIRSASYCLGVLQALAFNNVLKRVDYLSTVSGGGYIGSSVTWLLSHKWHDKNKEDIKVGVGKKDFPYGTYPMIGYTAGKENADSHFVKGTAPSHRGALLRFLRQHGKYLTPGQGINGLSLLGVVIRGSILSIFVYFSLLVLLFSILGRTFFFKSFYDFGIAPTGFLADLPNMAIMFGLVGVVLFVIAAFLYNLGAYWLSRRMDGSCDTEKDQSVLENFSYKLRRFCEQAYNYALTIVIVLIVAGCIPVVYELFTVNDAGVKTSFWAGITGAISTAVGFISSIMSFIKTGSDKPGKIPAGLLVVVASITLWLGLLLLAYHCSLIIGLNWVMVAGLAVLVLIVGWFANLNYISVHRYYRDRLMESFMPDLQQILTPQKTPNGASVKADKARLCNMCWYHDESGAEMNDMPYHIINTNVVLVSSNIAKFRGRGGDNFILTPAYCGSNATGWRETPLFMKGRMTLPTAMAISGAAVNPSTGVGGEGMTRKPLLSMLMGLLNIRLGYWASNPHPEKQPKLTVIPNFFLPGLSEMMLRTNLNEDSWYVQLSDGGHFENLGIYELVRRKAKLIIACDAAADPDYQFGDLSNALEKVRVDFGVLIDISSKKLKTLIPENSDEQDAVAYARQGFIVADIHYPEDDPGILIFMKSTFFEKLSADLYGYKRSHREFPNEPTSDQFFDEKQFEAYRELGYQTANQMIAYMGFEEAET